MFKCHEKLDLVVNEYAAYEAFVRYGLMGTDFHRCAFGLNGYRG